MARKDIGIQLDRNNLNNHNDNYEELYNDFKNVVDRVSDEAFNKVIAGSRIDWSQMVDTVNDLPSNVNEGETRGVKSDNKIYRYDGSNWIAIAEINLNPISEVDDRLTTQLAELDGVNVKYFTGVSDTEKINNAIEFANNNGFSRVFIPEGDYIIYPGEYNSVPVGNDGGIRLYSNMDLVMSPKTVLHCEPVASRGYHIIHARGVKNVTIVGGEIIGDRDEHLSTGGEWGHGIYISESENIEVRNVEVSNCWGDGVYVGHEEIPCRNIRIIDVISRNNRRQGLSVTNVDGLQVIRGQYLDTNGAAPESGIDIEPDHDKDAKNILLESVFFSGNANRNLLLYTSEADMSEIVNVEVRNCVFKKKTPNERGITLNAQETDKFTNVNINDCSFYGFEDRAIYSYRSSNIFVDGCYFKGCAKAIDINIGNNIVFNSNTIEDTVDGIYVISGKKINLNSNIVRRSTNNSVNIRDSEEIHLNGLETHGSKVNAIFVYKTKHSYFTNIELNEFGRTGVLFSESNFNHISNLFSVNNVFSSDYSSNDSLYGYIVTSGSTNTSMNNIYIKGDDEIIQPNQAIKNSANERKNYIINSTILKAYRDRPIVNSLHQGIVDDSFFID